MRLCLDCRKTFSGPEWSCPFCGWRTGEKGGFLSFAPAFSREDGFFPPDGFQRLAPLEEKNFWFRSRNEVVAWALRKWFPEKSKFLEIGCGTAFVLSRIEKEFPNWETYGSEIFTEALPFAAQRLKRSELLQMDARRVPFSGEFDGIGLFDTLEHISDDEGVLSQTHQALVRGGKLILTVPQHAFLWSVVDEFTHHVRRYGKKDLSEKLRRAGFKPVMSTSFVFFLLPLLWFSRLRQSRGSGSFDPEAEFRIHPFLNWILEKVLAVERILIRLGARFPAGGSLLIVAQKD